MKWTTPLLLVALLGTFGFFARTFVFGTPDTAREIYARVENQVRLQSFDHRNALRSLSRALKHPEARANDALTADILRLRASIYEGQEQFDKARSDIERLQALGGESDAGLELESIYLQSLEGQHAEALHRVNLLAARHPERADVLQLWGQLEAQRADYWKEQAFERARLHMVAADVEEAASTIERLCAQHSQDPRRSRYLRNLRAYFPDSRAEQLTRILDACDLASDHYGAAREAYAKGLEKEISIPALSALQDLLVASGRSDLVVDLGVASRVFPEIMQDPENLLALIDAMGELGQRDRIGRIVAKWPWKEARASKEFYLEAARVLFESQKYGALGHASGALRTFSAQETHFADFYVGYLASRANQHENALRVIDRFLNSQSPGPLPESRKIAYRIKAQAWRELGDPTREWRALKGVVDERGELTAEDHFHLATAQDASPNSLPLVAEESWTKGMNMAPERTPELMETWQRLGDATFAGFNASFDLYYEGLVQQGRAMNNQKIGPYTLWRIGRRHLEERRYGSAMAVANHLLHKYPTLVPALDLRVETSLSGRDTTTAGPQTLLTRLRIMDADETAERFLGRFEPDRFTEEEHVELIRLNPFGEGRTRVAQYLYRQEAWDRLLKVLRPIPEHPDPPSIHALRVRALVAAERYAEALESASIWLDDPQVGESMHQMQVRAALGLRDAARIAQSVRALLQIRPRDPAGRQRLAADLLQAGYAFAAQPIFAHLDASKGRRTREAMLGLAICKAITGDREGAWSDLERVSPFYTQGEAELAMVLLAAANRDWPALPEAIQRLRQTSFQGTPLQTAALALLEERIQMAKALAEEDLGRTPAHAGWQILESASRALLNQKISVPGQFGEAGTAQMQGLLLGMGDERRDPRDVAALLLALDQPRWAPWIQNRIEAWRTQGLSTQWTDWISTEALLRMGLLDQADAVAQANTQNHPNNKAAWDQRIRTQGALHPDQPLHPDLLRVRGQQIQQPALQRHTSAKEQALGVASNVALEGQVDQAVATLKRYLSAFPEDDAPLVRRMLAEWSVEIGHYRDAIEAMRRVLLDPAHRGLHPWLPITLQWLQNSGDASIPSTQRLSEDQISTHFATLAQRYPSDPLIALGRLKFRLSMDDRNILLASEEAKSTLETLRNRLGDRSLDDLRPGSSREWMQHFLNVSPIIGEEFCQEELIGDPGNLDLWLGLSYALYAQGRIDETRDLVEDLLKIADDPELHYRFATLLALEGEPRARVQFHLKRGDNLSGLVGDSARSAYLKAQMVLMEGSGRLDNAIAELGKLWNRRDQHALELPPLEIGRTYLTALVLRHQESDIQTLDIVTEEMLQYANQDPYAEDVIRAFRSMGEAVRSRVGAAAQ